MCQLLPPFLLYLRCRRVEMFQPCCWLKIKIRERCKGVHCVDLGESFPTRIYLQKSASIQPRTSPVKFARSPCTDPPGASAEGLRQLAVRRYWRFGNGQTPWALRLQRAIQHPFGLVQIHSGAVPLHELPSDSKHYWPRR